MRIVSVSGQYSLPVWRIDGFSRKFVKFADLCAKLGNLTQREAWFSFCEANTTEFWRYVPWVVMRPATLEVEVPPWGTEPEEEDFLSSLVYVDAAWAWDVVTLYELGARSVHGNEHFHVRWQRSPCGNGNLACLWKSRNPRSNSGIGNAYSAIFAHGEDSKILAVPPNIRWYQPKAKLRPFGRAIPAGEVLGHPLSVPSRSR